MSKTSHNVDNPAVSGAQIQKPSSAPTMATPAMMEQSVLLWRVRRELARLQRIGDWQAYQEMLAVVAPVLGEQEGAQKAHEATS